MMKDILFVVIPFYISLEIQLFCCLLFKNKFLRHAGLLICAFMVVMAVIAFLSDPGFFAGGNVVMGMFFLYLAASCLAGYGAAWGVYRLIRRQK